MLRGIEPSGGLKDYYLLLQQRAENEIEYLKTFIAAQSRYDKPDVVNKMLKRLRELLGLETSSPKKDEWMQDSQRIEQNMKLLKNLKIKIEK